MRDKSSKRGRVFRNLASLWPLAVAYLFVAMHVQWQASSAAQIQPQRHLGFWIIPIVLYLALTTPVAWRIWLIVLGQLRSQGHFRSDISRAWLIHGMSALPALYGTMLTELFGARNDAFILDGLSAILLAVGQLTVLRHPSRQEDMGTKDDDPR